MAFEIAALAAAAAAGATEAAAAAVGAAAGTAVADATQGATKFAGTERGKQTLKTQSPGPGVGNRQAANRLQLPALKKGVHRKQQPAGPSSALPARRVLQTSRRRLVILLLQLSPVVLTSVQMRRTGVSQPIVCCFLALV